VLAAWYVRKSNREFDPLREAAKAQAVRDVSTQERANEQRFTRETTGHEEAPRA
jgi:hypothetical protein